MMATLGQASALVLATLCLPVAGSPVSAERPLLQDFDALGAWFDGVAALKADSGPRQANASIAIVGAGISGLATALMLDSVGVRNWELVEATDRVGGRFRTVYVGGTGEWAEMGPMRLPYRVRWKSDNSTHEYSEHAMTYQLADMLNQMNGHDARWRVDFIPWIQHHANELIGRGTGRHPDGRVPTRAEIAADPALGRRAPLASAEYNRTKSRMQALLMKERTLRAIQRDPWRTHRRVMDAGLDGWSQQALMRHRLGASEDATDAIWTSTDYDVFWDEMVHNSNLALDGGPDALGETEWRCVDGGFNRLSDAFLPHVKDRLVLERKVVRLEAVAEGGRNRTRLWWEDRGAGPASAPGPRQRPARASKDYDYTVMTLPFTMTRFMELPGFSSLLSRAMGETGLRFRSACKVSLLFGERFWEQGAAPILGGYSMPESLAVGALYYPVYGLGEPGRPGLITHYRGGDWSDRFVSMSDEAHAALVLDAVASLHGERARELYTGNFTRLCWLQDEHAATAWCRPDVEQHRLYMPAYHRTEHNTVFVGEHTAPTHAWISSALHSAARGTVQLLLELGLVDEAKAVNERWMGRWIGLGGEEDGLADVVGLRLE